MTLTNPAGTATNPVSAAAWAAYLTAGTGAVYAYQDTNAPSAPGYTPAAMKAAIVADTSIGKGCIANTATLAAIVADATSIATLRADPTIIAAVQADQHVFPTTLSHKVQIKQGVRAKIRTSTDLQSGTNVAVVLEAGTVLYVSAKAYAGDTGVQFKILDGTYVNDYVDREDIELAPLDVRF